MSEYLEKAKHVADSKPSPVYSEAARTYAAIAQAEAAERQAAALERIAYSLERSYSTPDPTNNPYITGASTGGE